ncbi:MAG: EAL domain-containing protein [Chthoniobacterales bacterium]
MLPPALFLTYAFRQSAAQVERDLDFIGEGSLIRAEGVIDSVAGTLRKVASLTNEGVSPETVATLRQAVFLNRSIEAIHIRRGNQILCSSEDGLNPKMVQVGPEQGPIPNVGEFVVRPPVTGNTGDCSVKVTFCFSNNLVVEALVDPNVFNEFFDHYAHEIGIRVFILFGTADVLTSFGKPGIVMPPTIDLSLPGKIQWTDSTIARVSQSHRHPIRTVAITPTSAVSSKWARTAIEFSVAGAAVAALLTTMVIKVVRRTRSLEADLQEAVHFKELDVHYQPIIDLRTGRCVGAEALMRWNHSQRGMIAASEFIAVAEKTHLIIPMTILLLERVADDLEDVLDADPELRIGINLAPQHFLTHQIIDSVQTILNTRLRSNQIIFEITERGLVGDDSSPASAVMNALAKAGSKLAVDDFGTGYSSLSYLQRFRLDYLKIDKAFVDGISDADNSSGLVDQIIKIAKSLNMEIIAEGVEHAFQATYLLKHGVEYAQGWHFARPMPADRFIEFVAARKLPPRSDPN